MVKFCLFEFKKKGDALATFRLSTGICDRAWEIPFLDLWKEYSLACQTSSVISSSLYYLLYALVWCISTLKRQQRTSELSRLSLEKLNLKQFIY